MNGITMLNPQPLMGVYTDPGFYGKKNDDQFAYFTVERGTSLPGQTTTIYVALVADGVTMTHGGEQASKIAAESIQEILQNPSREFLLLPFSDQLAKAIEQANENIHFLAQRDATVKNMSTTIVLAAIAGNRLYIMHLGDSRAYLVRANQIHLLTRDHTWVQEAIELGRLTPAEARVHANRNVLQQYLGIHESIQVDRSIIKPGVSELPDFTFKPGLAEIDDHLLLQPGDVILLCSDGLTDRVDEGNIKQLILANRGNPQQATRRLVNQALELEETDNITVVLLDLPDLNQQVIEQDVNTTAITTKSANASRFGRGVLAMIAILFFGLSVAMLSPSLRNQLNALFSRSTPSSVPTISQNRPTPTPTVLTAIPTATPASQLAINSSSESSLSSPMSSPTVMSTPTPTTSDTPTSTPTRSTPQPTATLIPTPTWTPTSPPTRKPRPTKTPTPPLLELYLDGTPPDDFNVCLKLSNQEQKFIPPESEKGKNIEIVISVSDDIVNSGQNPGDGLLGQDWVATPIPDGLSKLNQYAKCTNRVKNVENWLLQQQIADKKFYYGALYIPVGSSSVVSRTLAVGPIEFTWGEITPTPTETPTPTSTISN